MRVSRKVGLFRRRNQSPDIRRRLLIFPYAGAGVGSFAHWFNLLPKEVDVCIIELPGRDRLHAEEQYPDWEQLVEGIIHLIHELGDVPTDFYGHSFGALIAYETARELNRAGHPEPQTLVVAAHRAPQLPPPGKLGSLDDKSLIDALLRYGTLPAEVASDAKYVQHILPQLRADLQIYDAYVYSDSTLLECDIIVLSGICDKMLDVDLLHLWQKQTRGNMILQTFSGGHMFHAENQKSMLSYLSALLWHDLT
jgi:medium-chain acyl-[acyl-carrier-protein] hydrolase